MRLIELNRGAYNQVGAHQKTNALKGRLVTAELRSHIDTSTVFQSLNTPYIVFGVDDPTFTILEENAAHAAVSFVSRAKTIGKPLFDVFPDTSEAYLQTGESPLLESIRKVIKTGEPDTMPELSYDLRDKKGQMTTKYWDVTHYPIKDDNQNVIAVFQHTKDITDEMIIGQQLEYAQEQLRKVLSDSGIGTWNLNIGDSIVIADNNLLHMFGIKGPKTGKGIPLDQFITAIHPADQERVQRDITASLKSKKPYEIEYRTGSKSGDIRWVLARGGVETDKAGSVRAFSGVVIDITDRKIAEQKVSDSERQLQFMAETIPQLLWIARPDGYFEYYNRQWYEYTGKKVGEAFGKTWGELVHPEDQKRLQQAGTRAAKTGKGYEIEYRLYHAPSGVFRWMLRRATPFRDKSDQIIKWYGTCTDIDDQKRSEQLQTFLSDASKELSSSLDMETTLDKVTKLGVPTIADWSSIDLYDEKEGFKQVSIAHIDPEQITLARQYREHNPIHIDDPTGIPNMLRTGKTEYYPHISNEMLEQYIKNKDTLDFMKKLNLHSIIIAPIRISGKVAGGISFISSDSGRYYNEDDLRMAEELAARISLAITNAKLYTEAQSEIENRRELEKALRIEKQKLESRVKERTEQLQLTNKGLREEILKRQEVEKELHENTENLARSNAELEDFAYVASHDLQEPLRKIQAFSNLLQSEYGDKLGDGADYVERMYAAAERMSTLIQDLLAFSRVSTKTNPTVKVQLSDIVSDVLLDLETRVEEVQGTVIVKELPAVIADPTHMRQLFQNLIGNALKFHRPEIAPIVEVTSRTVDAQWLELRVSDNGIGFDEKYLDRIFSVFQRLHGRDKYEGTGIGLAVCRKIVERYGGTIIAESEKDKGATFIIRLPRRKEKK